MFSTDPAHRARFTAGLRQLADFLDTHPAVPVPPYGTTVLVHADSTDDDGKTQVDQIANWLATIPDDDTDTGHYRASRAFGPLDYTVVAISNAAMQRHHAEESYRGCVTPDTWTKSA